MVQVEYADGTEMLGYFSCIEEARFTFGKGRRVDSAGRSLPVEEVGSLIAMLG